MEVWKNFLTFASVNIKKTMDGERRGFRTHWRIINGGMVPKRAYATERDALTAARFLNSLPTTIHKSVAYKCCKCGKWHTGTNGRELTDADRERYRNMLACRK